MNRRKYVYDWFEFFNSTLDEVSSRGYKVTENNENYTIALSVPGLTKDNIKIDVEDNVIDVSYNNEKSEKKVSFVDSFNKRYQLPDDSDLEKINAKVENGVLTITIPKVSVKTPKKSIVID